ncbi:MAG: serine/threonine-protein kinase, partial [Thiobacillus sp.]|nr:serine/threonine-protein kinase [Thiobacillus sp.]
MVSALGQGAMGAVYKAVDPLIERTVAIKTINLDLSKDERAEFETRFYREAKSAGRLNHSNIVTIYDVGESGDVAYIAMEYVEGESLREMLDSGVVFPPALIGRIAAQIAGALNYAHENQVVHRDIKPANIMITPNRDVKIMDFGIAQIPTGSRTQLGTVLGSPKYMAPEQVAGEATDGRTDIFALGVVLYEMLTGVTP